MAKITGGRRTYGEPIGIIMIEKKFPRIPGDVGNATTFNYPVKFDVIKTPFPFKELRKKVIDCDPVLLKPFIESAKSLERDGVKGITTVCGFLIKFQKEIASEVNVPIFTSSLLQIPFVHSMLGSKKRIGVITSTQSYLTEDYFKAAGAASIPIAITGMEYEPCWDFIRENKEEFDPKEVEATIVKNSIALLKQYPDIGAFVLECANMPPYSNAIRSATGLPVFDIITLSDYVYASIIGKAYKGYM